MKNDIVNRKGPAFDNPSHFETDVFRERIDCKNVHETVETQHTDREIGAIGKQSSEKVKKSIKLAKKNMIAKTGLVTDIMVSSKKIKFICFFWAFLSLIFC